MAPDPGETKRLLTAGVWPPDSLAKGQLTSASRWEGANEYAVGVVGYDNGYRSTGTRYTIPAVEGPLGGKTYEFRQVWSENGNLLRQLMPAAGGLPQELVNYEYTAGEDLARVTSNSGATTYLNDVLRTSYGEAARLYLGGSGKRVYVGYLYEDATRRLTEQTIDRDLAPTRVEQRRYTYDNSGNILSQVAQAGGSTDAQCYRYDGLARLQAAWTSTDGCVGNPSTGAGGTVGGPEAYWQTFTYDAHGNRDIETRHNVTGAGADVVRDYTYSPLVSGQPHTLRSVAETGPTGPSTQGYAFDAAGQMTSRNGTGQTWDAEGKLRTSTKAGVTSSYVYDAAGERLIRREPGAVTLYLGGTQLTLTTATQQVTGERIIDLGGASAVRSSTGSVSFIIDDHQGTGQWSIDASSLAATQRRMDPFGRARSGAAQPAWPAGKGFVGGDRDASGLTHLGAREYDPEIGSFISADPIIDLSDPTQMNGYSYANSSPVTLSDPSGLIPEGPSPGTGVLPNGTIVYTGTGWRDAQANGTSNVPLNPVGQSGGSKSGGSKSGSNKGGQPSEAEVQRAKEVKKRSLLDVIKASGVDILFEVLGINDIQNCFTKGDVGACVSMAVGALPIGKILKAGKIGKALMRAWDAFRNHKRAVARADDILTQATSCAIGGAMSFAGATAVLMGDGSSKRIDEIDVGDEVVATDPETGEQAVKEVTHLWVHDDTLVDLELDGDTITTTEDHPFWSVSDRRFERADELAAGEQVFAADGDLVTVSGLRPATAHSALAYNLTVDGIHTYHVGNQAILVHNTNSDCGSSRDALGRFTSGAGGESAAAEAGRVAHTAYSEKMKQAAGDWIVNRQIKGTRLRPDAVSHTLRIVRELKPNRPKAMAAGQRQGQRYADELKKLTGHDYEVIVDTYGP